MSDARADILAAVRGAIAGRPGADADACARRLAEPGPNLIPERGRGSRRELTARFVAEAKTAAATVGRVSSRGDVPEAIASFIEAHGLATTVRVAPALETVPWSKRPAISVTFGPAGPNDAIGVSEARFAIAETGTLMVVGDPKMPTTLNFLPDTHIVIVETAHVVGAYEDAWAAFRAEGGGTAAMPRAVNWITGPSRSADIELVVLLGVHGPRRLHILLLDGKDA